MFSRYKMQQKNIENIVLSKIQKYTFSSKSKCGDLKNARKQFNLLQNTLLCDDEQLKITYSESCDELFISLKFELNNPEKIDGIVKQFDEFAVYLDSISIK